MTKSHPDSGTSKSRDALVAAFEALVISKPYQQISVGNIVNKADVGRSTFYEHFPNKDALLRESLLNVVNVLADTASPRCDVNRLAHILEHFRDVGDVARAFFDGPAYEQLIAVLQESIQQQTAASLPHEQQTRDQQTHEGQPDENAETFTVRLMAETIVAMTRAWLLAETPCPAEELAGRMNRAALAIR